MDIKTCKSALEALLFANGDSVSAERLAEVLGEELPQVEKLLLSLRDEYDLQDRGVCLLRLEDRWQLAARSEYGDMIKKLMDNRRNVPLTPAALEVLAVIAYNQPVSRGFIEQVRGVDSNSTVSKMLEKGLIEEAGRLNLPGRPVSFRTTDAFLRTFGLHSLEDLPPLHEDQLPLEALAEEAEKGSTTEHGKR